MQVQETKGVFKTNRQTESNLQTTGRITKIKIKKSTGAEHEVEQNRRSDEDERNHRDYIHEVGGAN